MKSISSVKVGPSISSNMSNDLTSYLTLLTTRAPTSAKDSSAGLNAPMVSSEVLSDYELISIADTN